MKKRHYCFLPLIACLLYLTGNSQYRRLSSGKDAGKPATETTQTYVTKINDTCWQFDFYRTNGPMINSIKYRDDQKNILHGDALFFNSDGEIDSLVSYSNGILNGTNYYFNDTGAVVMQKDFSAGRLVSVKDKAMLDSSTLAHSKAFTGTETESSFAGGLDAWRKYLAKNLRYPQHAVDYEIQGKIVMLFIVDKDGHISDLNIIKSREYSLDQEALRMIRNSPNWEPAVQNGIKVKSYKKQPITFRISTK